MANFNKDEREKIKTMNGKIRKDRETQSPNQVRTAITPRRNNQTLNEGNEENRDEPSPKRRRTVQIIEEEKTDDNELEDSPDTAPEEGETRPISARREVLRFKFKK